MVILETLIVPDQGTEVILENLQEVLTNIGLNRPTDLNKRVFKLSLDTIKTFYLQNVFCNNFKYKGDNKYNSFTLDSRLNANIYPYALYDTASKLTNLNLSLNPNYANDSVKELEKVVMENLSDLSIDKKEFISDNYVNINFGVILAKIVYGNYEIYRVFKNLIKETYNIPYGEGTLLIIVIDQDMYRLIINTLYKVSKDFLEINDNTLSNSITRYNIHTPIRFIVEDLVKSTIAKQPEIGDVLIDNLLSHNNKSYMLLPVVG